MDGSVKSLGLPGAFVVFMLWAGSTGASSRNSCPEFHCKGEECKVTAFKAAALKLLAAAVTPATKLRSVCPLKTRSPQLLSCVKLYLGFHLREGLSSVSASASYCGSAQRNILTSCKPRNTEAKSCTISASLAKRRVNKQAPHLSGATLTPFPFPRAHQQPDSKFVP